MWKELGTEDNENGFPLPADTDLYDIHVHKYCSQQSRRDCINDTNQAGSHHNSVANHTLFLGLIFIGKLLIYNYKFRAYPQSIAQYFNF
jgi:hypothetical protein